MDEITAEQSATDSGWTPQDDFKGDPEKWKTAEDWNDMADNMMPILKAERKKTAEENQRLKTDLSATQTEISQLKKTMKQLVNVNENVSQRAYDKAKETIRKEKRDAIETQDGEKFENLEKQEADLDKAKPLKVDVSNLEEGPQQTEAQSGFFDRNQAWYGIDDEMTGYAKGFAVKLQKQGVTDHTEQLKQVESQVKKMFPDYFGNKRRDDKTVSDSTNLPSKKKSGFDWTTEAKDMFDTLKKDDPKYTKEQFIKDSE